MDNYKKLIIDTLKTSYKSIRIANIKPTGVLAVRVLVSIILVPILFVVFAFAKSFLIGLVDDNTGKLIDTGLKIIDHIFVPAVLSAIVGFLMLWIDKDGDGIPDKLEEQPSSRPALMSVREEVKK